MNTITLSKPQKLLVLVAVALGLGVGLATALVLTRSGQAEASNLPPVARQMAAFSRLPAIPDEQLPADVAETERSLPDPSKGKAIVDETRRLASGLGADSVDLYAFPTTGGAVCLAVTESAIIATCIGQFRRDRASVAYTIYSGATTPQTVAGLVPDDVTSVSVLVRNQLETAQLANNAFFYQAAPAIARSDIDALLVGYRSGDKVTRNLDFE